MSGPRVSNPREFWAGWLYLACGGLFVVLSSNYQFGTGARMGPAYFPTVLGCLLALVGLLCIGRSLVSHGEALGGFAWRPLVVVMAAVVVFGLLLPLTGLPIALTILIVLGSLASRLVKFDLTFVLWIAAFVTACTVVFITGLGLSMPLLGSLFD